MSRRGPKAEWFVDRVSVRSGKKNALAVKMLRKMEKRKLRRTERHDAKINMWRWP